MIHYEPITGDLRDLHLLLIGCRGHLQRPVVGDTQPGPAAAEAAEGRLGKGLAFTGGFHQWLSPEKWRWTYGMKKKYGKNGLKHIPSNISNI